MCYGKDTNQIKKNSTKNCLNHFFLQTVALKLYIRVVYEWIKFRSPIVKKKKILSGGLLFIFNTHFVNCRYLLYHSFDTKHSPFCDALFSKINFFSSLLTLLSLFSWTGGRAV